MLRKVPSPQECGLPEKFDRWRGSQEEALSNTAHSVKRVVANCMPTGSGKSAVAVAAAIMSGEPTAIVTNSRGLQDQYLADFAEVGMVDLRGRSNYPCDLKPEYTCEDGYAARCPYKGTAGCPATVAEIKAASSPLVVTNYPKLIHSKKYGKGLDHIKRVVFDEGHSAPIALAQALQITLHHREIEEKLHVPFLTGADAESFDGWRVWAAGARVVAEAAMMLAKSSIDGVSDPKPAHVKQYNHMRNLSRKLGTLSTARPDDWIAEEIPEIGWKFDPIRPGKYAESNLLLKVPKIIVMSATLRPKTMYMMGVGKDNFDFYEYPSEFDAKRCPIYHVPTMRVDSRNTDLTMLWIRIDQILSKRADRRGIIHTVSFQRQSDIVRTSRFAESMIINEKGEPPSDVIETFKKSKLGTILVSPSVGTGYDFPNAACRFQIICKIPFEPPSKILKAREALDKEYRSYNAMQSLVQAIGRSTRSKTDWSEVLCLDDNMQWFIPRYGHLAPKSFHNFFRTVNVLPQPLNL